MNLAFSIFDSKLGKYFAPTFMPSRGIAIRQFSDQAMDENTPIGKHPADYTLFEVGQFDDDKGVLINHEANVSLGTALEYLEAAHSEGMANVQELPKDIA